MGARSVTGSQSCAGRISVLGEPAQLIPASWQLERAAELTALCTIAGGAAPLAFANTKELKLEPPWHSEQSVAPTGTCVPGSTTTEGVPTKVSPGPWQLAQLNALTAA